MKFRVGPVPEDPAFEPAAQGWRSIREPDPLAYQILALPIMVITFGLSHGAMYQYTSLRLGDAPLWAWLVGFVLIIPVHEFCHILCHPGVGRRPATIVGWWSRKLVFYAHYEGEMSRNRFLLIFMAPFLILTVLPILAAACLGLAWWPLMVLALMNTLHAAGDLTGALLVWFQIPSEAIIRNKGWRTYWTHPIR